MTSPSGYCCYRAKILDVPNFAQVGDDVEFLIKPTLAPLGTTTRKAMPGYCHHKCMKIAGSNLEAVMWLSVGHYNITDTKF